MSSSDGDVGLRNPLRTLRHTHFRRLWTGELSRSSAQFMDTLTRGFLILQMTGSPTQLALVNATRGAPLLALGLVSGVLADRVSRKRLLLASQSMNIGANLLMAVLVITGGVEVWHVYTTAILIGVGQALNAPARQSALPSLVPADDLQSAVVLSTSTLTVGQSIGPLIGGVAVALVGIGGAYLVQAFMFVVAGNQIRRMDLPDLPRPETVPRWRDSAKEGVRYLRAHALLPRLLLVSLIPMLLVQPFIGVLPAIATERLGQGPTGTGLLLSAPGAGALLTVVALATLPPVRRPGRVILICAVGFSVSVALFAISDRFALALFILFVGGILQANYRTLTQALLLSDTEDAYRGRMSSVYVVNRGMMPLGSTLLGGLTTIIPTATAVAGMSAVGAAIALTVGATSKTLRRR